ncbi:hypothetical protein MCBRY_002508 [Methylocystis bryophila]
MKISVILPNFNHGAFIAQAFEGILAQTYQNWELCVVDDGSTDDSWAIIERYRDRDPRIFADRFTSNRGAHAAFRRCLELCSGELLYSTGADDYLSNSRFFELGVRALQRFPQAALTYARAVLIDGNDGRQLGETGSYIPRRQAHGVARYTDTGTSMQFIPPQEALAGFVSRHMIITFCALIARRGVMAKLGYYDEALGPQSDGFLNNAMAALYGAVFIDATVAAGRISDKTYSGSAGDDDYFRCHALLEKKFRALQLPYKADERVFAQFRAATIADRLSEPFQRHLFDTVRRFCDSVPPDAFVTKTRRECERLEAALNERIEKARAIFDELAGPVVPLTPDPDSRPRPWLKPVAEFFLTLGRVLGRSLSGFGKRLWEF